MTDVFLPMNGAARMGRVGTDVPFPGEPVPGLPRPQEPADGGQPFSAR